MPFRGSAKPGEAVRNDAVQSKETGTRIPSAYLFSLVTDRNTKNAVYVIEKLGKAEHNLPRAFITDTTFRGWETRGYEFSVMTLASPNVMSLLRKRYDMIAN